MLQSPCPCLVCCFALWPGPFFSSPTYLVLVTSVALPLFLAYIRYSLPFNIYLSLYFWCIDFRLQFIIICWSHMACCFIHVACSVYLLRFFPIRCNTFVILSLGPYLRYILLARRHLHTAHNLQTYVTLSNFAATFLLGTGLRRIFVTLHQYHCFIVLISSSFVACTSSVATSFLFTLVCNGLLEYLWRYLFFLHFFVTSQHFRFVPCYINVAPSSILNEMSVSFQWRPFLQRYFYFAVFGGLLLTITSLTSFVRSSCFVINSLLSLYCPP